MYPSACYSASLQKLVEFEFPIKSLVMKETNEELPNFRLEAI